MGKVKEMRSAFAFIKEIAPMKWAVTRDRFVNYAMSMKGMCEREAENAWKSWRIIADLNWAEENFPNSLVGDVMDIAHNVYDSIYKGGSISYNANDPNTPKWRVYYREGEGGKVCSITVDLLRKEDVIAYSMLLQRDGVEILLRVDFVETIAVAFKLNTHTLPPEMDLYDGDIISCLQSSKSFFSESSGLYVCTDRGYKRLVYTPGRGYMVRGVPDFEQNFMGNDMCYSSHVFNSFDKEFSVVGNIYADCSVLKENREG